MFASTPSSDYLPKQEVVYCVDYALITGGPIKQGIMKEEVDIVISNTFQEAVNLPPAQEWRNVVDKDMGSPYQGNIYDIVSTTSVPVGQTSFGARWVFMKKADGLFKARLVAQGWGQVPGVDYGGTFAAVYRVGSIRIGVAIAADHNHDIEQLDVQTAYLKIPMEEDVNVKTASGHEVQTMKLNKSLYSLRQFWLEVVWDRIDISLVNIGLVPTRSDPCVYLLCKSGVDNAVLRRRCSAGWRRHGVNKEAETGPDGAFRHEGYDTRFSYLGDADHPRPHGRKTLHHPGKVHGVYILERFGVYVQSSVHTRDKPGTVADSTERGPAGQGGRKK